MDTLIVGAGPAGLALAACLTREGVPFTLVERGEAVGTSWRNHYQRLHLHTVKKLSALPGLPFADDVPVYPSREQVVEYLESYVRHHGIEVELGMDISRLRREDDVWLASAGGVDVAARRVILTTGLNRKPIRPSFDGEENFAGEILHSADYRSAEVFRGKRALVVGAGNTGGEIALDLCESGCTVGMCIRGPLHVIPRDFLGRPAQVTGVATRWLPVWIRDRITSWVSKRAFGDLSDVGIVRPQSGILTQIARDRKIPLIDIGTIACMRAGDITVYPGIEALDADGVRFVDGRRMDVDMVVLATGYRSGIEDLVAGGESIVDDKGYPVPTCGATQMPGLYVLGFSNVSTGLLRQIAIESRILAAELAASA